MASRIFHKFAHKYINFIDKHYLSPITTAAILTTSVVSNIAYENYKASKPENHTLYKYKHPTAYGLSNGFFQGSILILSWPIMIPSYAIFITTVGISNQIELYNKIDIVSNNN